MYVASIIDAMYKEIQDELQLQESILMVTQRECDELQHRINKEQKNDPYITSYGQRIIQMCQESLSCVQTDLDKCTKLCNELKEKYCSHILMNLITKIVNAQKTDMHNHNIIASFPMTHHYKSDNENYEINEHKYEKKLCTTQKAIQEEQQIQQKRFHNDQDEIDLKSTNINKEITVNNFQNDQISQDIPKDQHKETFQEPSNPFDKSANQIEQESADSTCLFENCNCLKRIRCILREYNLINNDTLVANRILIKDKYEHQQLFNDFFHVKIIHIDNNNALAQQLCVRFVNEIGCTKSNDCQAFLRHHSKKNQDKLQRECDKVHVYFLHSTIQFGNAPHQINVQQEMQMDERNKMPDFTRGLTHSNYDEELADTDVPEPEYSIQSHSVSKTSYVSEINENKSDADETSVTKKSYVGKREDNLWWHDVTGAKKQEQIYRILVEKMGVFRWQNPHGFGPGQNRQMCHYKPKFKNIKQEALHNPYEPLSQDSWNQTISKSKVFERSWASKKIRSQCKGFYDDRVTGHYEQWREDKEIDIESIVTLKLYTDFDKLQFALKKCFRYEAIHDILNQNLSDDAPMLH
eukprot:494619_1